MENQYAATGKRKNAIACVILRPGSGKRMVNGHMLREYVKSDTLVNKVEQPFKLIEAGDMFDVTVRVKGGGLSGQAGAIRLGVARALAKASDDNRKQLRKNGFLTRDSRVVERKKYGLAGARKRYQFSKR